MLRLRGSVTRRLPLAMLVALTAGCGGAAEIGEGLPVPAYTAATMAGETVSLASLRGEVVLLNVWATWCPPCRHEMPAIERLHDELQSQGLRVVAVSIDGAGAQREIEGFVRDHDLSFLILHDADQRVTRTFGTLGVPETLLIGRDGRLLKRWIGRIDPHSPAIRIPVYAALDAALVAR